MIAGVTCGVPGTSYADARPPAQSYPRPLPAVLPPPPQQPFSPPPQQPFSTLPRPIPAFYPSVAANDYSGNKPNFAYEWVLIIRKVVIKVHLSIYYYI